jgi:hypothetical protein
MTDSEANVSTKSNDYKSLVVRAPVGEALTLTLAAWRTGFESLALSGFGHAATLAAMGGISPVGASLSLPLPQRRSTSPARASVRQAGRFLPAPQPHSAALPSAAHHGQPLAAGWSAAPDFTRRCAATRPRWRQDNATPNQALQRTGSAVTAPAADHRRLSAHRQVPRPLRLSLSLGSMGD